ncbi:hypothetical protein [Peptostreptococcus porci]|nr:hypothetical protein [Peptostreptococcus porci]MDY4128681.1 hypothetical protein [Peptostreptococcus porci]
MEQLLTIWEQARPLAYIIVIGSVVFFFCILGLYAYFMNKFFK